MAHVKFVAPLTKFTEKETIHVEAKDVRELCKELIKRFNLDKSLLLDEEENLSKSIILMVNRRNAFTLKGADTKVNDQTEVLIMQFFGGG